MRRLCLLLLLAGGGLMLSAQSVSPDLVKALGATEVVTTPTYFQLSVPAGRVTGATPKAAGASFLDRYAEEMGLAPADELRPETDHRGRDGRHYLRYGLYHRGFPVLGRGLTVKVGTGGNVRGLSGTLLPTTSYGPATAPATAQPNPANFATAELLALYPHFADWNPTVNGRVWTNAHPWVNEGNWQLATVVDVHEPGGHRAERVYLSDGKVVFHHQLHCDLLRQQFNGSTGAANNVWVEGDAFPGALNADDQEMITATGEAYYLYWRTFGRRSYDNADGVMRGVSAANLSNCPNATATGNAVRHCAGVVADDVVGHEWSHNYTGQMNGLIYAYESGALNEAYADVFGETIDLLNNRGGDTNDQQPRTGCNDNNARWKLGEDTDFSHLRDMWNPECRNDPSSRSSADYHCDESDNGGVHINSGVINRLYVLLVDGGSENGVNVSAIGMTKALHLFFHAADNYVGPTTGFAEFAPMLLQSATDLTGVNLPALTLTAAIPPNSGEIISAADVQQLQNAIDAVQLNTPSPCPGDPTLAQDPPAACAETEEFVTVFAEDWEGGTTGWVLAETPVNPSTWDPKPWAANTQLPDGRPGQALFAPNPRIGDCQNDLDNGSADLTSPVIDLPVEADAFELRFNHYYSTENNYDGGVLYLSRNGGAFTYLPEAAFVYNGYDSELVGSSGNDNPVAGLRAFHGSDNNSTSGTWGTTVIDLVAAGAAPGDAVQIRWSMTHDGCNGWLGWYLDEVTVGYCRTALPVTYTSIEATPNKDHILVEWATAAEESNAGFYVERRAGDETGFERLGFVAAGTAYRFADYRARGGVDYSYRLRQVDLDGTEYLSDLVSARLSDDRPLTVFPNPARERFTVLGPDGPAELYDLSGRRVRTLELRAGQATVGGLRPGVYVLRVGREVRRVVVH